MKREYENVKLLLHDTVSLLCRNSLSQHGVAVHVQGLIGVTVDDSDVFLVQFDEAYRNNNNNDGDVSRSELDTREDLPPTTEPPPVSNRRKRRRPSETTPTVAPCETGASETDSDVIFIGDEANEDDIKPEFGQLCYSAENDYDYGGTDSSSLVYKSEDTFAATDPDTDVKDYTRRAGGGDELLGNTLADGGDDRVLGQVTYWQSESAMYDGMTAVHQTTSVKCEQTTTRPHNKQVLIDFVSNFRCG